MKVFKATEKICFTLDKYEAQYSHTGQILRYMITLGMTVFLNRIAK